MADIKKLPSRKLLRMLFTYDIDTGKLYWKVSTNNRVKVGDEVGTPHKTKYGETGYRQVSVQGNIFLVHRIIWKMMIGRIPDGMEIDHIDRDRTNNTINNLRLVTRQEQMQNVSNTKNRVGSTGEKGVRCTTFNKFQVWYPHNKYHGTFDTLNEAVICRNKAMEAN